MDSNEFLKFRKRLNKTQQEIAELLGISVKAVHSYEQGWRNVPTHVERQLYFLLSRLKGGEEAIRPCWVIKKCPAERKKQCPASEFQAGKFCWFINGTICECKARKNWKDKIRICKECEVMQVLLDELEG
ncbi:MAG: helix-turn-helix domain-containing protein [Desulfobulbales bacterium]|nr:helix-turn-helix domain-containing protein [Desulfobulbales bacterium]